MNHMITKITKGQQITIPAEIRNKLNLRIGNKVEIEIKRNNIVIKPIEEDIEELFKKARKIRPKYKLTVKQMDKFIENEALR